MTLLIGAKANGAVVIGADRKTIRGGESHYDDKLFEFQIGGKLIIAAEGLTGIRDDFFLLLRAELQRLRGVETLYEVKLIAEDIIANLTERYSERIDDPSPVAVLMGGREQLNRGPSLLYFIHGVGYGEQVSMRCSGHGGTYAHSLAKFLVEPSICENLTPEEVARRIAFIIFWVSEDVDSTVGGQPQVAVIRDESDDVEYLTHTMIREVKSQVDKVKKDFATCVGFECTET